MFQRLQKHIFIKDFLVKVSNNVNVLFCFIQQDISRYSLYKRLIKIFNKLSKIVLIIICDAKIAFPFNSECTLIEYSWKVFKKSTVRKTDFISM